MLVFDQQTHCNTNKHTMQLFFSMNPCQLSFSKERKYVITLFHNSASVPVTLSCSPLCFANAVAASRSFEKSSGFPLNLSIIKLFFSSISCSNASIYHSPFANLNLLFIYRKNTYFYSSLPKSRLNLFHILEI